MLKQFLKIANVKNEKDFLRKFPTEEAFFQAYPEAEMLVAAKQFQDGGSPLYSTQGQALRNFMNTLAYTPGGWMPANTKLPRVGGYFADGGQPDPQAAMMQQGPPPDQGQGAPGGDDQLSQIIKFIVQSLQQGMAPEQIIAKLSEMGVPQDQAQELVSGVVQQLQAQGGQQQGPQEEMAEGPQGQEAPPQEAMEGQAPPMGRWGGKFADGGQPSQQEELMQQVAQALQQGAQPEQVMQQLVQMGIPQDQAQQLIQMIMQQMQGGGGQQAAPMQMYGGEMRAGGTPCYNCGGMYAGGGDTYYQGMSYAQGGPYIPVYNVGGNNPYMHGGKVKKYKKGGEYEMSENEIQDLINKGYKIQYL